MKRLVSIVIVLTMLFCVSFAEEDVYSVIDEMSSEELQALYEYIGDKIEENSLQAVSPESIEMKMSSSRSDQVLVGQPLLVVDADEQLSYSMTVEYVLQGAYANAVAKSFSSYNTRYGLDKGEEWVLVYLKIEGLGNESDKITLSDYYFSIVDKAGVDCGNSYIADNPLPIRDMYGDSVQYAWYGMPVKEGTELSMTYQTNMYKNDTLCWFDLTKRIPVDTSETVFEEVKLKSKDAIVFDIQMRLGEYGFMVYAPSGVYDTNTQNAMKKFQKKVGLKASGAADEETLRILFSGAKLPE